MPVEKMTLVERLENPAYGDEARMAADMQEAAERIKRLKASLAEMLGVYWGAGDGQEPPPVCIQTAQRELSA
jgi:hypothetical protein